MPPSSHYVPNMCHSRTQLGGLSSEKLNEPVRFLFILGEFTLGKFRYLPPAKLRGFTGVSHIQILTCQDVCSTGSSLDLPFMHTMQKSFTVKIGHILCFPGILKRTSELVTITFAIMTTSHDGRKLGVLCSAVQENDLKTVQNLLWGDKVNQNTLCWNAGSVPTTPLIIACKAKHYCIVEHLLTVPICPADVNMADGSGRRPIEVAIHAQDVQLLSILLHKGTKQFKPDLKYTLHGHWRTPLLEAVYVGNTDIVRELIKAGADVNLQDDLHDESPLYAAAKCNNTEMCSMLLQNGCDMNAGHDVAINNYTSDCDINPIMRFAIGYRNPMDLLFQYRYRFRTFQKYPSRELIFAIMEYAEASAYKLLQWGMDLSYSNPNSRDCFQ